MVTGAGAGVGRAVAEAFAARGHDVAILARDKRRLEAAADAIRARGPRVLPLPADVADPDAVEAAAASTESALGPIDIWVNGAMATVFAPVHQTAPEEYRRATEVTYLGTVHGTLSALKRMRARDRGTIVNIGSALSYRAIPLQSAYCAAKFAIRGFTDSLRCELAHSRSRVRLTMVQLPAVNTPQFDWARNHTGHRARPVPPIFQPEPIAAAIVQASLSPHREVWIGWPAIRAILAQRIAPGLLDRYLGQFGYSSQLGGVRDESANGDNLFAPVPGARSAHGRFDSQATHRPPLVLRTWQAEAATGAVLGLAALGAWRATTWGLGRRG